MGCSRRTGTTFVAITAALAAAVLDLAACGAATSGQIQTGASGHLRPANWELLHKSARKKARGPVSAKMADVSFGTSSIQEPQNGGWGADAGSLNIYVTAGAIAQAAAFLREALGND